MKLPISWLSEFILFPKNFKANANVERLVAGFVQVGFEVEEVIYPTKEIKGPLKVGTVIGIEELTGLKKPIRYVTLDLAEKTTRQVICGATNFAVGDQVVVALPGAVLPGGFAISARETYGRLSDGMICSSREVGLGDDHSGIIVLQDKFKNGSDALTALGADDPIIDIAVNPDRGYAMSVRGAARELAMALGYEFKDVDRKAILRKLESSKKSGKIIPVEISDKTGADLIYLRSLTALDSNSKTPVWMARRLSQAGMRPISLAVDVTNYVMLELGQPLHAFDSEKINGKLRVQRAGRFKKIVTLDKQERKLSSDDLLIADDNRPLALAGTMGGLDSEVSESTTRIALEAAHFNSVSIARNSRRHILSSEASRRFERGVDPQLAELASARAALLLIEYGGAKYHGTSSKGALPKPRISTINPADISSLLGTTYSSAEVAKALISIGCRVTKTGKKWKITSPSWRSDLNHISDFAEEVARYFGYERIPSRVPNPKIPKSGKTGLTPLQQRRRALTIALANKGFTEVQNYPFVSQSQMDLFAFTGDRAKAFKIANPISEEHPLLRTHLSPGLLETAARNLSRGSKSVALFESGLVFRDIKPLEKSFSLSTSKKPSAAQIRKIYESVPFQSLHIGGVVAGEIELSGWWGKGRLATWEDAVATTSELLRELTDEFTIKGVDLAPWHPGRCAEFIVAGKPVAHAGEIHPRITAALGLPEGTIFFAILVDALPVRTAIHAKPVTVMPAAIQDISLFVPSRISAAEVTAALQDGAGELLEQIELFDRFQREGEDQISLAFSLTFRALDRTLTSEEVSILRERAGAEAARRCGATIRS